MPAPGKGAWKGRCVRARQYRNSVAQLVVLAGIEWGAQALGLCKNILNNLFPNCVSTVPDATLFEAELPGLEGLDLFFFFDTLALALIFGLLIIRL